MIDEWWADSVKDIYRDSLRDLGGDCMPLDYGPGHIAWEDGNFSDDDVRFCLQECETNRDKWIQRFGAPQLAIAQKALERLLDVPEEIRDCDPFDNEDQ